MKKALSLLIVFSLVLSMCSFVGVFAAGEELIFSESFEGDLSGWKKNAASESYSVEISEEKASDGKKSVHLVDNADASGPMYTGLHFEVKAGETYTAVGDFYKLSGNSIKIYFKYFDADKKQIFNKSFGTNKDGEWETVGVFAKAPEGAAFGNVVLSGTNVPVGECYIDNVKVFKGEAKIDGAKITSADAPAATTTKTPVNTIIPSEGYKDGNGTIVYRESFENGLGDWQYTNASLAGDIKFVTTKASDGKTSAYLADNFDDKAPGIKSPYFAVTPGNFYSSYMDICTESGDSVRQYFKYFDKDFKQVESYAKSANGNDWCPTAIITKAPDAAVCAQVWACGVNAAVGAVFADNIKVYDGNVKLPEPEVEYAEPTQVAPIDAKLVAPVDNKLKYFSYNEYGDMVGDYSYAGFYAGECELPVTADLPVAATIEPSTDPKADDTDRIQKVIDKVYNESTDDSMKVIKLKAGRYNIGAKGIRVRSGIVLSGEGQHENGTVLYANAASQYTVVKVSGNSPRAVSENAYITDEYVKSGSNKLNISADRISDYKVGDLITIFHPASDEWCEAMGMKGIINVYDNDTSWKEGKVDMYMERTITAINGTEITFDFPVFVPIATKYSKAYIYKTADDGRSRNVGIENLRIESYYNGSPTDENHATTAISITNAKDVFVRDVSAKYFYSSLISSGAHAKQVTARNCSSLDPVSQISGSRRYSFAVSTSAQQILYTGCYSYDGRHDFETSLAVTGPIAFVDNIVDKSNTSSETHGTWSTGVLYDNVYQIPNGSKGFFAFANRGIYGTSLSQGWAAGSTIAWNCLSTTILGHKPPLTYQNFIVGSWGNYEDESSRVVKKSNVESYKKIYRTAPKNGYVEENFATKDGTPAAGDCYKESEFTPVEPRSLYKAQLAERFTGNIQNARPNAPIIVYPRFDREVSEKKVKISGVYQLGATKVTVYIDNKPYDAKLNGADNSFELEIELAEGTHKIYATQTIGAEGTKTSDRFITIGEAKGNPDYLQSIYTPDQTRMLINDPRPVYNEYEKTMIDTNVDKITIIVDDAEIYPDVEPYETNGRVLVPMRAIFEALKAEVTWDEATATATAKNIFTEVKITENSATAYVNGETVTLDVPATIKNGRFMVPVRFISESFGAEVGWIDARRTVTVKNMNKLFNPVHGLENELRVIKAIQSGDDGAGSVIDNIFDNNYSSKWAVQYDANNPEGAYGILDLSSVKEITGLHIAFASGNKRNYTVDILVSSDGVNFTPVTTIKSGGKSNELEKFDISAKGRYVKLVGKGNSVNAWMSILELAIIGK